MQQITKYPINIYEEINSFKIYYSNVDLLTLRLNLTSNSIIQSVNLSDKARGMLAESFVAEQLTASGFTLHYLVSGNSAKVDFVIQQDSCCIPLAVKSTNNVRSKSLQIYIKNYNPKFWF